ncbi:MULTISPECIES: hypothetical protein [unclassified Halomonas]|uniref:hypothetical protein n=1 Tax=unclassified Halomonas TaxID=2609666 RepID=UPI0021E4A2EF|nr:MULTISPECIES: hypothetical protein [unclassified Halomonas]UYG00380.1 hypothetical protein OCT39_02150 [Halomonas sp. GD1P12]WNL38545.1 hypothetical protein RN346_14785 [Halomonas sp. PAMB 3232]WNL41891.1 hypothetical protein RN347_14870 [Halomonas sp. PAMB 3264]
MIAKRERGRVERALVDSLTRACEEAKFELDGFVWLTHEVDYGHFPASLRVIWVFDTDAHLAQALKGEGQQRLEALTTVALEEAGVAIETPARHIEVDSEQACARTHGGDWRRRLRDKGVKH